MNNLSPTLSKFWNKQYAVSCFPPTWYIFQRLGSIIAFIGYKIGISPNGVTAIGGLIGFFTIWQFGTLPTDIIASIQLTLMFGIVYSFDCADGQLARATEKTSEWGKWFDLGVDLLLIVLFPLSIVILLIDNYSIIQLSSLVLVLVYGRALALLTSAINRTDGKKHMPSQSMFKKIIQSFIDSPTFYTLICLSRIQSDWVFYTSVAYGILFVFVGIYFSRSFLK